MAADQMDMGLVPYNYNAAGSLGVWMYVSFSRLAKRAKCDLCGQRRILYAVGMGDVVTSPGRCAKCAGLR